MNPRRPPHRLLYRGQVVDLVEEEARFPDGHRQLLEIVRHPGGSAVVAVNEAGAVCLLRQYRHVPDAWLWELPAGKHDRVNAVLETARRELEEEAGLTARDWTPLGDIITSPGVFTEQVDLFLARNLSQVEAKRERLEYIETHWVDLPQALSWARDGTIADAKTIIGLFRASSVLMRG